MKAYNTPKDELLIKSDEGEELVKITPEKTTIANLEGGGGSSGGKLVGYGEVQAKTDITIPANSGAYFNQTNINVLFFTFDNQLYTPNSKTKIIPYANNNVFGGKHIVINSLAFQATSGGIFGYISNFTSSSETITTGNGFLQFYIFEV